jgi:phytoene/squalene synthetase
MVGEMRLQWWRDAVAEIVAGQAPRNHPVLQTAAPFLQADPGAGALWDGLIEARRWDLWREGFADDAALWAHLEATASALTWLSARALGAPEAARPVVVAQALAGGLADWIAAFPDLRARGRHPLPDPAPKALRALAATGLSHHAKARAGRAGLPRAARPALWPHAGAASRLRRVLAAPEALLAPDAAPLAAAPRHALWAAVLLNRC